MINPVGKLERHAISQPYTFLLSCSRTTNSLRMRTVLQHILYLISLILHSCLEKKSRILIIYPSLYRLFFILLDIFSSPELCSG